MRTQILVLLGTADTYNLLALCVAHLAMGLFDGPFAFVLESLLGPALETSAMDSQQIADPFKSATLGLGLPA